MAQLIKLTPANQLRRFHEDCERVAAGGRPDFSIGQQIGLLIRRVDALERASAIEAGTAETAKTGSVHESAGPQDDAHPSQRAEASNG